MKKTILASLILFASIIAYGQEDDVKGFVDSKKTFTNDTFGWKKGAYFAVNGSNVGLSNWAAGGQENITINGLADVFAIYKKGKSTWENYGKFGYGVIKILDDDPTTINDFQKNEDNLFLLTKYGYKIAPKWNLAGLLQLESQMFRGYAPTNLEGNHTSNIFAPAYGLASVGFDYRPNDNFSMYISPVTGKFTIVADQRLADSGYFGVERGKQLRVEMGWYAQMRYQKEVMKNITYQTRLDLFDNYDGGVFDLIDVNWENTLNMKVNKFISASIFTHLKYDHDIDTDPTTPLIDRKVQFKYVLGVGLAYRIGDSL